MDIKVTKTKQSRLNNVDFNNLGFGKVITDHMLVSDYKNGKWSVPEIIPYQPISLNPAAKIFHYGQSIFEGLKAYKDSDETIWMFRPLDNCKRLNISAKRLAIPEFPENYFMEGLRKLLQLDSDWIPSQDGSSLYIRPFIFATSEGFYASAADEYKFIISCSPSGTYFSGKVKVKIEDRYARAANGGVGFAKAGGNYGGQFYPSMLAKDEGYQQVIWTDDNSHSFIEEAGAMNVFIRINDTLITSPISDRILDGITRKSLIELAIDKGIDVEVRKITVNELIEAANNGSLKEMFGAGTAAVISPISLFGYNGKNYTLPELEDNYATKLKKWVTDIQTNKSEDKFGWRFRV